MRTDDFDYSLPPELIAQTPAERRDGARMMVLHRATQRIEHRLFADLPEYLDTGDLLVVNNTRVIPARIFGTKTKEGTGGKVEFLLLEELSANRWTALMRCRRRPLPGENVLLADGKTVVTILADEGLGRVVLDVATPRPFLDVVEEIGVPPLPPYIQRKDVSAAQRAADQTRYQTVYARAPGAVAAPTAGLHFTPELFAQLAARGIPKAEVTLHVGIGTFRPVTVDAVEEHRMDEERWWIAPETAQQVEQTRAASGRIVAVGTTSVRTLETAAARPEGFGAGSGRTDIFIYPPYTFRVVDAMVTNFHLPKSTLIMMISAFAGKDFVFEAYRQAVAERYRFYSYGDCMLIL